jgi:DNA-binding LytR/AlgR family response regulator
MTSTPAVRVFVTDDEAPARRKLLRYLTVEPGVLVGGEAGNGRDTIAGVQETNPDLLFLDIQMPGMDGFEVVDALEDIFLPRIIFVTAHDEYALRALQIHAFDYLLKPFDQARFSKAVADARCQHQKEQRAELRIGLRRLLDEVRP